MYIDVQKNIYIYMKMEKILDSSCKIAAHVFILYTCSYVYKYISIYAHM